MAVKYPGLLVPEADKHQALYQGLLGMGSALSGGPSNAPVSFAQQLGRGGQSFNKSYQDRINQSKQDQMGNQKYQMQQAQMEAQKMKILKAQQEQADEEKRRAGIDKYWVDKVGPQTHERQANIAFDPYGTYATDQATRASSAAGNLKFDRQKQIKQMEIDAKDTRTPLQKNLESRGLVQGTPAYTSAAESSMSKRPYFDPQAEVKKASFKATGARYDTAMEQIDAADKVLFDSQQMLDLVNSTNSGTFADTILSMKKAATALGYNVDLDGIANAEAMKSKGMDFVLQRISQTKGAISEKEMAAFKEASAGLGNTPEGNRMILELSNNVAKRMKAEANAVREAYGANPSISRYALDNVKLKARKDFGDLMSGGAPADAGGLTPAEEAELQELEAQEAAEAERS